MLFVERANLFISVPRTYRVYVTNHEVSFNQHEIYSEIERSYGYSNYRTKLVKNRERYFMNEPFTYINQVITGISSREPECLICCYDSYQLSDRTTPPLYVKKFLNYKKTVAFSITDQGAISPLSALDWLKLIHCKYGLILCMEQIYSHKEGLKKGCYDKADALSLIEVTNEQGDYQVYGYGYITLGKKSLINNISKRLAENSSTLINALLDKNSIHVEDTIILAHNFSGTYQNELKKKYNIYSRDDIAFNLATADPFYSLEDVSNANNLFPPYIVLTFVDSRGSVGCLLLKRASAIAVNIT